VKNLKGDTREEYPEKLSNETGGNCFRAIRALKVSVAEADILGNV
jgi:hypothetical protein